MADKRKEFQDAFRRVTGAPSDNPPRDMRAAEADRRAANEAAGSDVRHDHLQRLKKTFRKVFGAD